MNWLWFSIGVAYISAWFVLALIKVNRDKLSSKEARDFLAMVFFGIALPFIFGILAGRK